MTHPRDLRIKFDEPSHTYSIDGEKYPISVTGLSGLLFPKFDADNVIRKMMRSRNWTKSKYYGMTKEEIKKQWEDIKAGREIAEANQLTIKETKPSLMVLLVIVLWKPQ